MAGAIQVPVPCRSIDGQIDGARVRGRYAARIARHLAE